MRYERSQLRITTWPGVVPEVEVVWRPVALYDVEPAVAARRAEAHQRTQPVLGLLDDPKRELVIGRDEEEFTYVPLPSELVLRGLLDLDIDDPGAVCAFLWNHGIIEVPFEFPRPGRVDPNYDPLPGLADSRAYLHLARALALHWIAHKEGQDVVEPWRAIADLWGAANPQGDGYLWSEEVWEAPSAADDAWTVFVTLLNEGLRPYQARVEYIPDDPDYIETGTTIGGPHPDLYSGLCLQLANIVTEDLPVLRCANTTCQRVFIRQEGRAEKGQHRTVGVMYCSRTCARAQANRNYRQRQRKGRQ